MFLFVYYTILLFITRKLTPLASNRLISTAIWAPKGSSLAYVLNNDIYYHKLNDEKVETRRLTFDGKAQDIYNGVPDWVYEGNTF